LESALTAVRTMRTRALVETKIEVAAEVETTRRVSLTSLAVSRAVIGSRPLPELEAMTS